MLDVGLITKTEHDDLHDAATMMYACALRVFQLRLLTRESFIFDKEKDNIFVSCRIKGAKDKNPLNPHESVLESKIVHPDFKRQVAEIIDRLSKNNNVSLFTHSFGFDHGQGLENKMMDINALAAETFCWSASDDFHGTHVFRHGAAQDAFIEGGLRLVMARTGHQSIKMAGWYPPKEF